jgi:hypothetical protein
MLDPLLTDTEVSRITGRARSTLQKDRVAGIGIPFVRIGRQVRYRAEDVATYLAALPRCRSTAEADMHDLAHTAADRAAPARPSRHTGWRGDAGGKRAAPAAPGRHHPTAP